STTRHPELDRAELAGLRADPPRLGELAAARRRQLFGPVVQLRACADLSARCGESPAAAAFRVVGDEALTLSAWPNPAELSAAESYVIAIDADDTGAEAWLDWLGRAAARAPNPA